MCFFSDLSVCHNMKPEQERVRNLLTDTVTLLCKNGLQFQDELKVEGVIGITLDNNEVFVVHINEAFCESGALKAPPKNLGNGSIGATALSELPGTVGSRPRSKINNQRVMMMGNTRGRPFSSAMRRGTFNSRRLTTGRPPHGYRGRGLNSNPISQPEAMQSDTAVSIVKVEEGSGCESDSTIPDTVVEVTPLNSHNEQMLEPLQKECFVNFSDNNMTVSSDITLFDPMNENVEDSSLEPSAKRLHIDAQVSEAPSLDSVINAVSNSSLVSSIITQDKNHPNMLSPQESSILPEIIKQEPLQVDLNSSNFPSSLQPMGVPSNWHNPHESSMNPVTEWSLDNLSQSSSAMGGLPTSTPHDMVSSLKAISIQCLC